MVESSFLGRTAGRVVDIIGAVLGIAFACASPTWVLADTLKARRDRRLKTAVVTTLNHTYLGVALLSSTIVLAVAALISSANSTIPTQTLWLPLKIIWAWFLLSRALEVFRAFYGDAFDKLAGSEDATDHSWSRRVRLALNSYLELILNFALLYGLLPSCVWAKQQAPRSAMDLLFYSASTITTSGGGGFTPAHWSLQLLTAFEIACGLILLVVCFAIYAGRAFAGSSNAPTA